MGCPVARRSTHPMTTISCSRTCPSSAAWCASSPSGSRAPWTATTCGPRGCSRWSRPAGPSRPSEECRSPPTLPRGSAARSSTSWASRSVRRREREIAKARERLATTSPDRPDDMAVATELGVPLAVVRATDADAERARVASLHSLEGDGVDLPAPGWRCPEDVVLSAERLTYVAAAVAELPERLRIVVDGHYLRGRTFEEIAADLGITRARVYQLRADAVLLMRDALDRAYGSESECRPEPSGVAASRRTAYADAVHGRYLAASGRA